MITFSLKERYDDYEKNERCSLEYQIYHNYIWEKWKMIRIRFFTEPFLQCQATPSSSHVNLFLKKIVADFRLD